MQRDPGRDIRRHFTYANVMSTLSVFLIVAGGTAVAASVNDSGDIASQAVKNSDVKKNTLKADRLKDGAAVGSAEVIDNSLTGTDIDEAQLNVPQPAIPSSLPPSGPAGGSFAGEYPNPTIAANAVGSSEVAADSLAAGDLAPNSVSSSEVADNAVGSSEVAANAIGSSEVAQNSLGEQDLGEDSVGQFALANEAVSAEHLRNAGTFTSTFGSVASGLCDTQDVDHGPGVFNDLTDDLILITPPASFSNSAQATVKVVDSNTFRVLACNHSGGALDPDGGGGLIRYVTIDFPG